MQTVSVIIVHYLTPDALSECLASIDQNYQVIVVDNSASTHDITTLKSSFGFVNWIDTPRNLGFGAACNLGLSIATNELVLFLNPDAVAHTDSIAQLSKTFDDPEVVACGGRLENTDGSFQESACVNLNLWAVMGEQLFLERTLGRIGLWPRYWISGALAKLGDGPFEVAQVMGACLMVRRIAALETKFDESFFLYCEDTDFCKRLSSKGKIFYVPQARFTHQLGLSSSTNRWWSVAMYNRGKELYFAKHHGKFSKWFCIKKNREGALLRMLLGILTFRFAYSKLFWKVFTAPVTGPKLPDDAR